MLKLKINKNDVINDLILLDVYDVISEPVANPDDEGVTEGLVVTCYHSDENEVMEGDKVSCTYTVMDWDGLDSSIVRTFTVNGSDNASHSFTFISDNLIDLNAVSFNCIRNREYMEDDTYYVNDYIYVYFDQFHLFDNSEYPVGVPIFFVNDNGMVIECVGEPYGNDCIRFPLTKRERLECEQSDEFCKLVSQSVDTYNISVENNRLMAIALFKYYGLISVDEDNWGNASEVFNDEMMSPMFDASPFTYKRYNMMFDDAERYRFDLVKPGMSLSVPLLSSFSNDLRQETDISENFVDVEKKKVINNYTEMEKNVYVPVYKNRSYTKNIVELRFNLHFRQRTGDDWRVEPSSSWNGVKPDGSPMNSSNDDTYGFFSYQNKSEQSDLLSYLGFSDGDVKYRRNVLKKSFIRLSFYDSDVPTAQNLLCYSTVFVDTGKLFGKYMRNFSYPKSPSESFGYSRILSEGETKTGLSGGRVNREPYWNTQQTDQTLIESLRLSSQFSVKDKYSSDCSSEGFYLYLWKDYVDENVPSDIYMKVEFNHAGFGRVIPFMLPYDSNGRIKSFEEVVSDNGYSIKEYLKYSYIHFKCGYEDDGKCVYYLDYNQYLTFVPFSNGVLSLNLYEAKLKNESD